MAVKANGNSNAMADTYLQRIQASCTALLVCPPIGSVAVAASKSAASALQHVQGLSTPEMPLADMPELEGRCNSTTGQQYT